MFMTTGRRFPERPARIALLSALAVALLGNDTPMANRASPTLLSLTHAECVAATQDTGWPRSGNARQVSAAAFSALLADRGDIDVDRALANELTVQSVDASAPDYGRIVDPVTPGDTNDTAFGAESWGPILLRFASRVAPPTIDALRRHGRAALAYFAAHPVSVDYTNIHLLKASEEVLLGDALDDFAAQRRGMDELEAFDAVTSKDGIHEFESPTYYALDLDALSLGSIFATQPTQRAAFARAQNYVWREIAANIFVADGRIAGAQSRSYDPLRGADAPMALQLMYAGLNSHVTDTANAHCFDAYLLARKLDGYVIPRDVIELAREVPRTVTQRVASGTQDTKYTYVTRQYAIGSSNEDYDETDRVAAIDLAGGASNLPVVRIVGDKTGTYFGATPHVQIDGERVWNHVKTRPAIVQNRNYLVALTDLDGNQPFDGGPLTLDILFPAAGALALDGRAVDLSSAASLPMSTASVASVQVGKSIAAARIALAESAAGGSAKLAFAADGGGLAAGVVRAYALQADSTPAGASDLRAIVLMGVDSGDGSSQIVPALSRASISSTTIGKVWSVRVELANHTYEIDYDLASHRSLERRLDGVEISVERPLNVNGVPIVF